MKKIVRLFGDHFLLVVAVIAAVAMLFIAGQGRAMGFPDRVGEYDESRQTAVRNTLTADSSACLSPIVTAEGKKICPIITPGHAVGEALDEQLEEAP